ncbi:Hypothetical predicted protein, partial [Paramuricea clavata]
GKGLRYHSYQIGYFLWGYILVLLLLSFTFFVIYLLSLDPVQDLVVNYMKRGGVYLIVAIFSWLSLRIITVIFRDNSYSKDVISINNRNAYMVISYFWFFIGLPMGFFSAVLRILKAMAVGALMLPRIDHSVMPDGFQRLDRGFNAYICYLHVETAYRNPVLRVFCQMLVDETQNNPRNVQTLGMNRVRKWTFSAQSRARWFLALTLARNPQLASDRKPDVQAPQPAQAGHARYGDVVVEIDQFCADNTAFIQDNALASALPPFPPFNVDDDATTTGQRWDKWTKRFNNFLLAMNITDATRKRALLLHYIGPSAFDIFETLTDTGEAKDYDKAIDRLTEHFTPQRNIDYETYLFRQARQHYRLKR